MGFQHKCPSCTAQLFSGSKHRSLVRQQHLGLGVAADYPCECPHCVPAQWQTSLPHYYTILLPNKKVGEKRMHPASTRNRLNPDKAQSDGECFHQLCHVSSQSFTKVVWNECFDNTIDEFSPSNKDPIIGPRRLTGLAVAKWLSLSVFTKCRTRTIHNKQIGS